ncbi:hypothetical protein JAAARDRAFT_206763 [Jaapia argillacea MUCL 33604]|uniref:F-box domain-containing protein n=1 Tax=Jaapia argillacea MUCL 33604 TaxID=933084 RepID=A0A067PVW4_9AGAM|nr:hypothetical protein JAAARDRAFT_206763 [Jaapia argillacea MUCL 33604]
MITPRCPRVPVELLDIIFSYLWWDKTTVRSCSTVCKEWQHSAQRQLFTRVTVEDDIGCHRLANLFAISPHIPPFIRDIRIYGLGDFQTRAMASASGALLPIWRGEGLVTVVPFLKHLTSIKVLRFQYLRKSEVKDQIWNHLASAFGYIKTLKFVHADLQNTFSLLSFLDNHPLLDRLVLEDVKFVESGLVEPTFSPHLPHRFRIASVLVEPSRQNRSEHHCGLRLLQWSLSNRHHQFRPSTVELFQLSVEHLAMVGRFIRHLGPVLEHLRVGMQDGVQDPIVCNAFIREVDLSPNTSLRSLHINESSRVFHTQSYAYSPQPLLHDWLPPILARISSTNFLTFSLEVWTQNRNQLLMANWEEVSCSLGNKGVKQVVFWGMGEEAMKAGMPYAGVKPVGLRKVVEVGLVSLRLKVGEGLKFEVGLRRGA